MQLACWNLDFQIGVGGGLVFRSNRCPCRHAVVGGVVSVIVALQRLSGGIVVEIHIHSALLTLATRNVERHLHGQHIIIVVRSDRATLYFSRLRQALKAHSGKHQ